LNCPDVFLSTFFSSISTIQFSQTPHRLTLNALRVFASQRRRHFALLGASSLVPMLSGSPPLPGQVAYSTSLTPIDATFRATSAAIAPLVPGAPFSLELFCRLCCANPLPLHCDDADDRLGRFPISRPSTVFSDTRRSSQSSATLGAPFILFRTKDSCTAKRQFEKNTSGRVERSPPPTALAIQNSIVNGVGYFPFSLPQSFSP
jgi:hypothetical protein